MKEDTTPRSGVDATSHGPRTILREHIVEIVSDSGEGAQKAGTAFASVGAKVGNGVWTVEIIPAEIKPPMRSVAGASGIRVRMAAKPVSNMGDYADMVVALNEQVLYGRIQQKAYKAGTVILLESKWSEDPDEEIRKLYEKGVKDFQDLGFVVHELPLEEQCMAHTQNPRVGKNMFVLGMLGFIYGRSLELLNREVEEMFSRKGDKIVAQNQALLRGGYEYAEIALPYRYEIPAEKSDESMVVMNGNQAVGLGVMASGMDMVSMYPITPATSASHYLAEAFPKMGGCVHQAEDEIAAIGFAIGASYAGKTACTITSGPGLALKTEFLGLAVMAEIPLVLVLVQRGGPSTGLPTKVEQGDLLAALYGQPGDAPKIVIAPSTIEECFHFTITARKLAETFRTPVIVLTDANLATGVQPFARPQVTSEWFASPIDQSVLKDAKPYDWNEETGLSSRPIPGQRGGEYVLTGLNHNEQSRVVYDPDSNQRGCEMRSRKLATLGRALSPPEVYGDEEGDLLIVGWGSTLGAIEEAVDRARAEGMSVSSTHLRFLSPLQPGLKDIFSRFDRIMTVEINYSDAPASGIECDGRRYSQLAWLLRAHTLIDIDCWSNVHGQPLRPGVIYSEVTRRLGSEKGANAHVRVEI